MIGYIYIIAQTIFCVYLLLKARNRFKREYIPDICELGAKLYGDWLRPWIQALLVATNSCFLMCYCMFIGFNIDQLACKTFEAAQCHQNKTYTAIVLLALYPIYCLRKLSGIGYFSAIALVFTLIAVILILIICT